MSTAQHLSVRPMVAEDLERVLTWRNHPEIRKYMYTQQEIQLSEHAKWFATARREPGRRLLIFEIDSSPLGFVSFSQAAPGEISNWGFYLAPEAPRGTGTSLGETALSYAFEELKIYKVCGQALAFNDRSIRLHRKLNFHQEGTLRHQHFDGVTYHDVVCFGLLSAEWTNILETTT